MVFHFCWIAGGKGAKERGEVQSNLKTHNIQIWVFERKCAHCGNSVVKSAEWHLSAKASAQSGSARLIDIKYTFFKTN